MLKTAHLQEKNYKIQKWKNGLGETQELAIDEKNPFRWRLSCATLDQSGPFSLFEGYERVLVLIHGSPIRLSFNGKPFREIAAFSPTQFSGEWKTQCEVSGSGKDFNLFLQKGKARGDVYPARLSKAEELQFPLSGSEHFIFLNSGKIEVLESNLNEKVSLKPGDTYWVSRNDKVEYLNLRALGLADSVCLWVIVHYL